MKIFETVSFHLVKPCDFSCKFCYATFNDFTVNKQLSVGDCKTILFKLKEAGVKKVTFAGGEPMLYKNLYYLIEYAKRIGLTTSIISNGGLITKGWLDDMEGLLDWVGISIDSLDQATNKRIGRERDNGKQVDYKELVTMIKHKFKLKINTVVNAYNHHELIHDFITFANPDRWKIFQALKVIGQNDQQFDEVKVSDGEFKSYCFRNYHPSMVIENNRAMTGSYVLIDPIGRLFEDSKGTHTYSDNLIDHSVDHCMSQINVDREMFLERGGIYNW